MPLLDTSPPARLYLQLVLVSVIWGGTFIAGRILSDSIPPLLSASLRFIIASAALLSFLALSRTPLRRISARQGAQLLLLGFFGVFCYNIAFFYGLQHVSASRASLIAALNPAAIALASFALHKEALSITKMAGISLCLIGAVIVIAARDPTVLSGPDGGWYGDVLILGCVGSWVIYSIFSRSLSQAIGPLQTVTYSILAGTLLLCVMTCMLGEAKLNILVDLTPQQWGSLLYLGAMGSALAYIWYYDGIRRIGATRSGVFIALNPLSAVLLGTLLLDEQLSAGMGPGGAMLLFGIVLSNISGNPSSWLGIGRKRLRSG
jgi:drug/metabolite transporter (DMT)-like permease